MALGTVRSRRASYRKAAITTKTGSLTGFCSKVRAFIMLDFDLFTRRILSVKALFRLLLASIALCLALSAPVLAENPRILIQTSEGDIKLELYPDKAPKTVENFLVYVKEGAYDGTQFHRVIPGFMIQGGGFTEDFQRTPTHPPVQNEADNGLKNTRGTIAMARTSDPHSATNQFFINDEDNSFLDYKSKDVRGWGYAVFGEVTEGMETVDKISDLPRGPGGPFNKDVPKPRVMIEKVTLITE
jgi:cyclophilin family peptidyl-prolyl cis-trans isomerase